MRSGTHVDGKSAIAIWTTKAVEYSSLSLQAVNKAVRVSGFGKTQEKRDFLRPGSTDKVIIRNGNSCRQSCICLFSDDPRWPLNLLKKIKKGITLCLVHQRPEDPGLWYLSDGL